MRKTILSLCWTPFFLFVLGLAFCVPHALACCVDMDGDGYGVKFLSECPFPEFDCDDTDPAVNPGATEGPFGDPTCSDGKDNDCDGLVDAADPDCWECEPGTFRSCDTGLLGVCADGTESCGDDGFWDGECVQDVLPSEEVCDDGLDNNCNGLIDLEDPECAPPGGCSPAAADAAVYGNPPERGSGLSALLFALLLPVGAAILLRRVYRKR